MSTPAKTGKKSFEERLGRLEDLNDSMRAGNISLEEAVAMFEEGISLARGLEKELAKVERKIEILLNEPEAPEDKPELGLFDDLSE